MRVIATVIFKGGVGKTSITVNLAHALVKEGKRVLLIDADRQRNTSGLLQTAPAATLYDVILDNVPLTEAIYEARPNLFLVPSHHKLDTVEKYIALNSIKTLRLLQRQVQALTGYDFVLFDTSTAKTALTDAVLLACQEIIIPVQLEPYAVNGLVDAVQTIGETLQELEHTVKITSYIPSNLNYTKGMTQVYLRNLKDTFGEQVAPPVRTDANISKAQDKNKTIFEYAPNSKAAHDFTALATHLLISKGVSA
jgi:chromosome partitioning protein